MTVDEKQLADVISRVIKITNAARDEKINGLEKRLALLEQLLVAAKGGGA